jgi:hypothetical protein
VRKGLFFSPLTYSISTNAEGSATRDYPASSVNREITHQMKRKHTRKVDVSKARLVRRSPARSSFASEK